MRKTIKKSVNKLIMLKRIIVAAFIILNIQACEDITQTNQPSLSVKVSVEDTKYLENASNVLRNRFNENRKHSFSSVETKISGEEIELVFYGGAPPRNRIEKLINTRGDFKIVAEGGLVLIKGENVIDALSKVSDGRSSIMLSLDEEGATRMHSWTSKNIGKVLEAKFDGKTLTVARVREAFGRRFQITSDFPAQEARDIAMYLRSGALNTDVEIVGQQLK